MARRSNALVINVSAIADCMTTWPLTHGPSRPTGSQPEVLLAELESLDESSHHGLPRPQRLVASNGSLERIAQLICALCQQPKVLRNSHIIAEFRLRARFGPSFIGIMPSSRVGREPAEHERWGCSAWRMLVQLPFSFRPVRCDR